MSNVTKNIAMGKIIRIRSSRIMKNDICEYKTTIFHSKTQKFFKLETPCYTLSVPKVTAKLQVDTKVRSKKDLRALTLYRGVQ